MTNRFNDRFQNLRDREEALQRQRERNGTIRIGPSVPPAQNTWNGMRTMQNVVDPANMPPENLWGEILGNPAEPMHTHTHTMPNHTHGHTNIPTHTQINMAEYFQGRVSSKWWDKNEQGPDYSRAISTEKERLRERGRHMRAKYIDLFTMNRRALTDELNTNKFNYSHQSKHSIEVQLLKAISDGVHFRTRTTEYNPADGSISLFDEKIVFIDKDNFQIKEIVLPIPASRLSYNVKLFRLRLRQLGIYCVIIKGSNRLYLDDKTYVKLVPGIAYRIPNTHKIICLPKLWLERTRVELPCLQLPLPFGYSISVERFGLPQFDTSYLGYKVKFFAELTPGGVRLSVDASCPWSGRASNGFPPDYSEYFAFQREFKREEWLTFGAANLIRMLMDELKPRVEKEAHKRDLFEKKEQMSTNLNNTFYATNFGINATTTTTTATTQFTNVQWTGLT